MSKKYVLSIIFLAVILWFGFGWLPWLITSEKNHDIAGTFGDTFGAVNSLFSGLAFTLLIIALHLQRRQLHMQFEELALQRKELRMTRREMKRSAAAQEKSELALQRQAESLLYAAYLNALSSLRQAIADEAEIAGIPINQHERIKDLRSRLEGVLSKIDSLVAIPPITLDEGDLVTRVWIDELREIVDRFALEWRTERGNKPEADESLSRAQSLLNELASELAQRSGKVDSKKHSALHHRLEKLIKDAKDLRNHQAVTSDPHYRGARHRGDCNNYWAKGETLAHQLRNLIDRIGKGRFKEFYRPKSK